MTEKRTQKQYEIKFENRAQSSKKNMVFEHERVYEKNNDNKIKHQPSQKIKKKRTSLAAFSV